MSGVLRHGTAPESGEPISIYRKCQDGCGFPLTNRNIMIKYNFKIIRIGVGETLYDN